MPDVFEQIAESRMSPPAQSGGMDPFEMIATERTSPKKTYMGEEIIPQLAIGGASGALAGPGTFGSVIQSLVDMLPGGEKSAKARRIVGTFLSPELSGATLEDIKKIEKGLFGEKLEPKTPSGRIARKAGEFGGSTLTTGSSSSPIAATAGLSGASGQAARELGAPESVATGIEVFSPLAAKGVAKVIKPHKEGVLRGSLNAKQKEFYDQAKKAGLTDAEITPLLQSERRVKLLGPLAKKTKAAGKALMETRSGVGELFQPLKERASKMQSFKSSQSQSLIDDLTQVAEKLEKTPKPSSEKQKAIDFLRDAIRDIDNKGTSPEELINFFQDINEQKLFEHLKPAKDAVMKSLRQVTPELAGDMKTLNEAYSKASKLRSSLGVGDYEKIVSFGERALLLAGLAKGIAYGGGFGLAASVLGQHLARRVATKMLTDPRWQNISSNFVKAAQKNNRSAFLMTYNQLKEKVKEDFPEEYEDVHWPED